MSRKKGFKHSHDTRMKISMSSKGKKMPASMKEKRRIQSIGKTLSEETKRRISESLTGRKLSREHIEKLKGEKCHRWRGGITPNNIKIRNSIEYKLWRKSVFERDKYTCVWCYKIGGSLNADHIKPFSLFPELRFAIDNGRTLCIDCHKKTETYGNKKKQFILLAKKQATITVNNGG